VFLSYDLLFPFRSTPPVKDVAIIYMDDRSFNELKQDRGAYWNRKLHAQLLDRLTKDQARLVVFDVVFDVVGSPTENTNLVEAMRRNGRVILAAALDPLSRPQIQAKNSVLPLPEFMEAGAGWGITEMMSPEKAVVRQYFIGSNTQPSLPWKAAKLAGSELANASGAVQPETWLNYYGAALTLPHWSYCDAFHQPAGTFQNKVVFVGARPKTLKPGDEADAFRTPYTLWRNEFTPGVEITATAFLNFMRNDGLIFWKWQNQVLLVLLAGFLFGATLPLIRPLPAIGTGLLGMVLLLAAALAAAQHHIWFAWTVIALAQIPAALAWSLRCHFHRLKFEKEVLQRTLAETSRWVEANRPAPQPRSALAIPDHALLRLVGKGGYGEVWLARNAVGMFHAAKIVRRRAFPSDEPYEREFKGIQKFMPISRSHPGLVHLLHVGRNDAEGFFFCIMEAADDEISAQRIDPGNYSPKTLGAMLVRSGKLDPKDCLRSGLALSSALEHLHRQQLVHRDIKPANIIYVNGAPKLADIGLVTEQRAEALAISQVGTEGYIPPEGAGSPSADIYALGKVLYEALMGRDRRLFPEVPTAVWEQPSDSLLRRLNEVIARACATNVAERYQSAGQLHEVLLVLERQFQDCT
jgi:CHASE2 domain-containing sensor protein